MEGCCIDGEAREVVEMGVSDQVRRDVFADNVDCVCPGGGVREG